MRLRDRVALITGSSRGIGRECALALAREGCDVVVAAKSVAEDPRLPGTIYTVAKEIEALGRRALPVPTDVRHAEAIAAMVKAADEAFGRIDILINNAGALYWRPVLETPAKRFDLVMGVNARAAFLCAQAVLPLMIARRWGHIINMSPPIDVRRTPGHVAYMISKYGMTLLTHGLSQEVREHGIAVHSLWPATMVESQATINQKLGSSAQWRKASIVADAVVALVTKDPAVRTGQALIDEDVLRAEGVTDFAPYDCVPDGQPLRIPFEPFAG